MDKKNRYFEELCSTAFLMQAWKHVRANKGVAGVDQMTVFEYERDLVANLDDLARRLREGRYIPMPFKQFEMQKANGGRRKLGIATVEDRIVNRALHDLLERIWEPVFLDCSCGFRSNRNVELAVKRVLDYRAAGDCYVVDADIEDCFGSLDHEVVVGLIGQRLRDKRLLGLIRLVLASGQACNNTSAGEPRIAEKVADFATGAVNDAVSSMLGESGFGYAGYGAYPAMDDDAQPTDSAVELHRRAQREAYKRLGRDALLLGLTCVGRTRRWLSPAALALTGAAALATAVYPAALRMIRKHQGVGGYGTGGRGAMQGSALSPLLANIVLHEFDLSMVGAGHHLTRYGDDWVITTRDADNARQALEFAERKLAELRLRLNPEKTRLIRFEQGLDFLGYKFDPFLLTATPPPASTQQPIKLLLGQASTVLRDRAAPTVSRFGKRVLDKGKNGIHRAAEFIERRRKRDD